MRMYIRGPHPGPLRAVLWSSGRGRRHSQWRNLIWAPFVLVGLSYLFAYWPLDIGFAVFGALILLELRAQRQEGRAAKAAAAKSTAGARFGQVAAMVLTMTVPP